MKDTKPQLNFAGNYPRKGCATPTEYKKAITEFDRLWESHATAMSRAQMNQLIVIIDAFEQKEGMYPE